MFMEVVLLNSLDRQPPAPGRFMCDSLLFSSHDRTINTLACVIALKSWDVHPEKCKRGIGNSRGENNAV
ncbi:hypothetical protein L1049_014300 [Liquidambar formosana]|uniref:Uncharacterized protein n=1 Tax=Liquidambar formosana TaxID=63359 RepID=A0AAP0RMT1_LIQFO